MKKTIIAVSVSLLVFLGCQGVMNQNTPVATMVTVSYDTRSGRGLDPAVVSVKLNVFDSAGVQVGTTLTDSSAPYSFSVPITTNGAYTFAAQGLNGSSGIVSVGNSTQTVTGATSITITAGPTPVPDVGANVNTTGFGAVYTTGANDSWGALVSEVYATSDGSFLYVDAVFNPQNNSNNVFLFVDNTSVATGSAGGLTSEWGAGYGVLGVANSIGATMEFAFAGWRSATAVLTFDKVNNSSIIPAGVTFSQAQTGSTNADTSHYKFKISYADIAAGTTFGQQVKIYVLFGKDSVNGGINSAAPAQAATGQIVDLANAAPGLILN